MVIAFTTLFPPLILKWFDGYYGDRFPLDAEQ